MIKKVTSKQKRAFNDVAVHPLQSWEWGEFRKAHGNEVVRLGVYKNKKLTGALQVIFSKIPLRAGNPLAWRQNPNLKIGTLIRGPEPTKEMLDALKDLAKEENAIFIKLEPFTVTKVGNELNTAHHTPITTHSSKVVKLLEDNGCVPGKTLFTPTSFWIDLTKSEDELMKSFSGKTRYNIRYAQRKGVKVVEDNSDKAFGRYLELTRETIKRQGFYAHTEKYHRLMWQFLNGQRSTENGQQIAHLLTARYNSKIITTWIVFSWHDFLYYPYGASTDNYKNVQANSLMMWEAIRFGKKLGLKTFDLWGREEGKGFTKFKEGFSPQVVKFLGSWDLITSPLYWPYRVAEFFRWHLLRTIAKFGLLKHRF